MKKAKLIFLLCIIVTSSIAIGTSVSYSICPDDCTCYELGTCDIFAEPLNVMASPFESIFGPFTFVVIWGIIMGVLWLRIQNTMAVGIVGISLAAVFQSGFSDDAKIIGYGLLVVAIATSLYSILTIKIHYPSS